VQLRLCLQKGSDGRSQGEGGFKKKYGYEIDPDNMTWDQSYKTRRILHQGHERGRENRFLGTAEMFAPYAAGDTFMARYLNYWDADKPFLSDPKTGNVRSTTSTGSRCSRTSRI